MLVLFALSAFIGSALLFLVEPLFARMVLPLLGGAPAVWNTCMVFYQLALLAGYLYAHLITERTSRRMQAMLQVGLLISVVIALPISVNQAWALPATMNPIGAVFVVLLVSLGLPFFVIATSSSLLQRWFSELGHPGSANPYVLYAASNLGSLIALVAYPLLIEPALTLRSQSLSWTVAYAGFAVLMTACAVIVWRAAARAPHLKSAEPETTPPSSDALRWVGLALVPSTLMLSVTSFVSMDVAAVPLLWILPLSIYLGTFVLAFSSRWTRPLTVVARLFPAATVLVVALVLAQNLFRITATIALHFAAFFVIALACHLELARTRPPARGLTAFYLWIATGGAIGGLFNALVAPHIFLDALEYPLAAIGASLLLPGGREWPGWNRTRVLGVMAGVAPVGVLVVLFYGARRLSALSDSLQVRYALLFGLPLLLCLTLYRTRLRMGLALASVLFVGAFLRFDGRVPLYVQRTFFGEHRVLYTGVARVLLSGTTTHGAQAVAPALKCEPLSYYSRGGPVGQFFDSIKDSSKSRFGVVGLGTASMAAYAAPGQTWTFFEINPEIEQIARDPAYFTYLRDCAPEATVVLGDARLSLANVPDQSFDVLVLDAFSSDAIPVHLMTTEAMQLYFRKLAPGGVLALHISNRYLSLGPVVGAVARHAGFAAMMNVHQPTSAQLDLSPEIMASRWTIVARRPDDFGVLASDTRWESLARVEGPVWTDDYSNVFAVLRW